MSLADELNRALNKLAKWRMVLTGWQLGTRSKDDPECQAVRDINEMRILMRAELTAITALLVKKGVFTQEEFQAQLLEEAQYLDKAFERRFPGAKSADHGIVFTMPEWGETSKGWKP